jgi:hypothetical protein
LWTQTVPTKQKNSRSHRQERRNRDHDQPPHRQHLRGRRAAGDLDDWAEDTIYPLTGTGKSNGDAWYDATITASSDPSLVGTTYEFGY